MYHIFGRGIGLLAKVPGETPKKVTKNVKVSVGNTPEGLGYCRRSLGGTLTEVVHQEGNWKYPSKHPQ